jgi:hypothetical protein
MNKLCILLVLCAAITFRCFSQNCNSSSSGSGCQDSVRQPDNYHIICEGYQPVCGCDDKTYRNSDAAYWWGGINQWSDGPCDGFDVDLYPNLFTPGFPGHLRIYMRQPGSATLAIFNAFGRKMLEKLFYTNLQNAIIPETDPYDLFEAQTFPRGLYLLTVIVNGKQKVRKFLQVTE